MSDILTELERLITSNEVSSVDRLDLPQRAERSEPIPGAYRSGLPGGWLMNNEKLRGCIWLHQARAMELAAEGHNLIVSTGTASGKSLVFQSAAFRMLDADAEAAVIVFYPVKALSNDQLGSWKEAARGAGFQEDDIVKVDGDVRGPIRARLLENAHVALMTPDVCHAWLLNEIATPAHRAFLARTRLVVIDEAHVLEGVFGSNFAYLFRRLRALRHLVQDRRRTNLQVIAASATISNPDRHLNSLTGLEFETVREEDNGAPQYKRSILHLTATNREEAEVAKTIHRALIERSTDGSFITFVDSRQGVERLALDTDYRDRVRPYRSGYEAKDREEIENKLRDGHLKGVISTSALELGIDIPHFAVGLNIGVPVTRKSFRQRLGRVGRQRPGSFAVVAEPYVFKRFGSTLAEYYERSVEPSYLYLGNRFVQFAHARCLAEELEKLSEQKKLPMNVTWPDGFDEVFDFAYAGSPAARPQEYDQINRIGGDEPHFNYPLRRAPEDVFKVVDNNTSKVAELTEQQAIREAFPGAIYLHMGKGWRVRDWHSTVFDRVIRVNPTTSRTPPQPHIRRYVNFSLDRDGIVDGRFRKGTRGYLAECHLRVNECVEGFREGGKIKLYRNLHQDNTGMKRKTRDFRTTGVVMRIDEDWFRRRGVKKLLADLLHNLMLREYSIARQDVDIAVIDISMIQNGRRKAVKDALVLFDSTQGTLRLTEPAYLKLDNLLMQLEHSIKTTPAEQMMPADDEDLSREDLLKAVLLLREWLEHLETEDSGLPVVKDLNGDNDWVQVYDVGSIVARIGTHGVLHDIEVVGHEFRVFEDEFQLFYLYDAPTNGRQLRAMVPASSITHVGDNWTKVYLNCETNEKREFLDDGAE